MRYLSLLVGLILALGAATCAQAETMYTLTVPKSKFGTVRGDKQYGTGTTIDCGEGTAKCSASYPAGTTVILSGAAGALGYAWGNWTGACAGTSGNRCVVVMDGNKTVDAAFKNVGTYTVTVNPAPKDGMIAGKTSSHGNDDVVSCGYNSASRCSFSGTVGATINLAAIPKPGFKGTGWTGACAGQGSYCNLTPSGAVTVGQNWTQALVHVIVRPPSHGTIAFSGKTCPGDCDAYAQADSKVAFTVTAKPGYIMQNWGGSCAGQGNPCLLTFDYLKEIWANIVGL